MVRDLELRLALVCFGGTSLAVYMNGLTVEFLSAVRASTARNWPDQLNPKRPLGRSGQLYKELLDRLSPTRRISVIIDAISGSSAGGINGIFLSRALAHDLSLDPLRDMWLSLGDIEKLMEGYSLAGRLDKIYLQPMLYVLQRSLPGHRDFDAEMQCKLNRFLRSRWFNAPFSGVTMLRWMIEAGYAMGSARALSATARQYSLMPIGHQLDLSVSVTNFYGELRTLVLDTPRAIDERAHGKSLRFGYRRRLSGEGQTDFYDGNVPGLGFAARATSSHPGAFAPVSIRDVDQYMLQRDQRDQRDRQWSCRDAFLRQNFPDQLARPDGARALVDMYFLDGGIIDNKPFSDVIDVVSRHPAQRPVDRRILFIDPCPVEEQDQATDKRPGFFETILGGGVTIPASQPIYRDLRRAFRHNEACQHEKNLVRTIRQDVDGLLGRLMAPAMNQAMDQTISGDRLAKWRLEADGLADTHAGFVGRAYYRTRLADVLGQMARLITGLSARTATPVERGQADRLLADWACRFDAVPDPAPGAVPDAAPGAVPDAAPGADKGEQAARWQRQFDGLADFLDKSDLHFRLRRLHRVLSALNEIDQQTSLSDTVFSSVKRRLYLGIEQCQSRLDPAQYPKGFLSSLPVGSGGWGGAALAEAVHRIRNFIRLSALDERIDRYLGGMLNQMPVGEERLHLFRAYVGFAFEDMMTLALVSETDGQERQMIRIARLSPLDSGWMSDGENPLMGNRLFNFGAFFSRRARENDYLWGRLHSADRLVDLIIDAAGPDVGTIDPISFKKRLFLTILDEEQDALPKCGDVVARLRAKFG